MINPLLTLPKLPYNRPACLLGFAPSRHGWDKLGDDVEIWTCNHGWDKFDRIDRLIEIHPWVYLKDPAYYANHELAEKHIEWITNQETIPIYMIEETPEVKTSVRYPIEQALELAQVRDLDEARSRYFASSFAYMVALAMLEERNPIYVYGFDMATDTEWFYQRANCEWWIGRAEALGFEVRISPLSPLCRVSKMYGYEGYQMVDRQVLEQRKADYKKQFHTAKEQFDRWQGILIERHRLLKLHKCTQKEIDAAAEQCRIHENTAAMCDGALQAIQNLLDECDLLPAKMPVFMIDGVRGGGNSA